jgi:hypothetical protein
MVSMREIRNEYKIWLENHKRKRVNGHSVSINEVNFLKLEKI